MSEIGEDLSSVRERKNRGDHILCLWVLLLPLVLILSLRKLWGFLHYGFPEENYFYLLSILFIIVHVILSYNILRSYCLNDKKYNMVSALTWGENTVQLQKLGILTFGSLSIIHQQKYARVTLHSRAHLSVEAKFDSEHFQFSMREIRASCRRRIFEWSQHRISLLIKIEV